MVAWSEFFVGRYVRFSWECLCYLGGAIELGRDDSMEAFLLR